MDLQRYHNEKHRYMMVLSGGEVIDATRMGGFARFINHSCEPNCGVEKWDVNGEERCGIFALRDIHTSEEITFDYKFESFSKLVGVHVSVLRKWTPQESNSSSCILCVPFDWTGNHRVSMWLRKLSEGHRNEQPHWQAWGQDGSVFAECRSRETKVARSDRRQASARQEGKERASTLLVLACVSPRNIMLLIHNRSQTRCWTASRARCSTGRC